MANSQIRVDVLNRAKNLNPLPLVILQKNRAAGAGQTAVAWRVEQMRSSTSYSFVYTQQLSITAADASGSETAPLAVEPGHAYELIPASAGNLLQAAATAAASGAAIEVRNLLGQGSISVALYRDGFLLAKQSGVEPGGKAEFLFADSLYLGTLAQVAQGQVLDGATVQSIQTEISLQRLNSAEITIVDSGANAVQFVLSHTT